MEALQLQSEVFRPEGGAAGQGIRDALGRPKLDLISLLIREAVQNSWDARIDRGRESRVSFSAFLGKFSAAEARCLKETVFAKKPANHPLAAQLRTDLGRIILQDRGTVGLTGPAFVEGPPRPEHRFVNFCRMFGRPLNGPLAGGTYGYGKGQYYLVSIAATIVVHTRSLESGRPRERLMGISLWNANTESLDTGRHWWGVERQPGLVGPAEGEQAAELAGALGFQPFSRGETGTSIMILAPRFDALRLGWDVAAKCVAESMAIWFWPRMLGACDDSGTLSFAVSFNGKAVLIPDPLRQEPLRLYADALRNLRNKVGSDRDPVAPASVSEVRCDRPRARLGWLSLALAAKQPRERFAISRIEGHPFANQIQGADGQAFGAHHIALMRGPGQVIRYLDCRIYPEETMEYAGVFLADGGSSEVDEAFAGSEPPSHDDWIADNVTDEHHKRYVRAALREIKAATERFADSGRPEPGVEEQDPLGAISAELGELISAPGTGATPRGRNSSRGGGGRPTASRLAVEGPGTLESLDGEVVLVLPFNIELGPDEFANVAARPRVVVAGGAAEAEAPRGGDVPGLIGWRNAKGQIVRQAVLCASASDGCQWEVIVRVPSDVMVGVTLELL